jgi:hypothetical protein
MFLFGDPAAGVLEPPALTADLDGQGSAAAAA